MVAAVVVVDSFELAEVVEGAVEVVVVVVTSLAILSPSLDPHETNTNSKNKDKIFSINTII